MTNTVSETASNPTTPPAMPRIGRKLLVTTALAVVCFGAFLAVMNSGLTLDMLPGPKPAAP